MSSSMARKSLALSIGSTSSVCAISPTPQTSTTRSPSPTAASKPATASLPSASPRASPPGSPSAAKAKANRFSSKSKPSNVAAPAWKEFLKMLVFSGKLSSDPMKNRILVILFVAATPAVSFCSAVHMQQTDSAKPVVVQPGAPGKPSKTLPPSTRAALPPRSQADVDFMQGMIMHHAQAVEMTALIASHTENKDLRSLGARISSSQSDEIKFMQRWLAARGERISVDMPGMDMSRHSSQPQLMPGMLTAEQ